MILPPQIGMCCTCKNGWPVEAQAKVGNYGSWNQKQGSRKCPGRLVGCPNSGRPTSTYHSHENDESNMARNAKSRREQKLQDVSKLQVLFCNKSKLQRQNLKCYTSLSI